jgi:hypothetical protein
MLTTDAYAFLNINDPVCAWATYRAVLVSAQDAPGFLSVWSAGMTRMESPQRLAREFALEQYRRQFHPKKISRLRGMFCFLDLGSAERALSWGGPANHFRAEYLAELNLTEAGECRDRFDANWVTDQPGDWIAHYWAGEACPGKTPIWETLVDGRLLVLGTDLRTRAYDVIKRRFPDSLTFLEIARMAAWVGSDLGSVSAFLREEGDDLVLSYLMDMRDAENPEFIENLQKYKDEGNPINWADITPNLSEGLFGKTPDLRPFGFRRPKVAMPYVGRPQSGPLQNRP